MCLPSAAAQPLSNRPVHPANPFRSSASEASPKKDLIPFLHLLTPEEQTTVRLTQYRLIAGCLARQETQLKNIIEMQNEIDQLDNEIEGLHKLQEIQDQIDAKSKLKNSLLANYQSLTSEINEYKFKIANSETTENDALNRCKEAAETKEKECLQHIQSLTNEISLLRKESEKMQILGTISDLSHLTGKRIKLIKEISDLKDVTGLVNKNLTDINLEVIRKIFDNALLMFIDPTRILLNQNIRRYPQAPEHSAAAAAAPSAAAAAAAASDHCGTTLISPHSITKLVSLPSALASTRSATALSAASASAVANTAFADSVAIAAPSTRLVSPPPPITVVPSATVATTSPAEASASHSAFAAARPTVLAPAHSVAAAAASSASTLGIGPPPPLTTPAPLIKSSRISPPPAALATVPRDLSALPAGESTPSVAATTHKVFCVKSKSQPKNSGTTRKTTDDDDDGDDREVVTPSTPAPFAVAAAVATAATGVLAARETDGAKRKRKRAVGPDKEIAASNLVKLSRTRTKKTSDPAKKGSTKGTLPSKKARTEHAETDHAKNSGKGDKSTVGKKYWNKLTPAAQLELLKLYEIVRRDFPSSLSLKNIAAKCGSKVTVKQLLSLNRSYMLKTDIFDTNPLLKMTPIPVYKPKAFPNLTISVKEFLLTREKHPENWRRILAEKYPDIEYQKSGSSVKIYKYTELLYELRNAAFSNNGQIFGFEKTLPPWTGFKADLKQIRANNPAALKPAAPAAAVAAAASASSEED